MASDDNIIEGYEYDPFVEVSPSSMENEDDDDDNLSEYWKELERKNFGKSPTSDEMNELIREFKEKIASDGHTFTDIRKIIVMYLRAGNLDADEGYQVFKAYLKNKSDNPHYYAKLYPRLLMNAYNADMHTILPHRDSKSQRIYVWRPGNWNPDDVSFGDFYSAGVLMHELIGAEYKTQIAGVVNLVDGAGFGFKQLRGISLSDARSSGNFTECFPLWYRETHIVNAPRFFMIAYELFKPFLSQNIKDNMHFHSDNKSLHKFISPEILPEEYGGKRGKFSNKEIVQVMLKSDKYYDLVNTWK